MTLEGTARCPAKLSPGCGKKSELFARVSGGHFVSNHDQIKTLILQQVMLISPSEVGSSCYEPFSLTSGPREKIRQFVCSLGGYHESVQCF